jgi:hypothetical protein
MMFAFALLFGSVGVIVALVVRRGAVRQCLLPARPAALSV